MKQERSNVEPETSRSQGEAVEGESPQAVALQSRPCGLLGALLLSLPAAQAEANVFGDMERLGQRALSEPILDRVASVRERLGVVSEQNPRLRATQDEALRLSQWPDWSDWYNR